MKTREGRGRAEREREREREHAEPFHGGREIWNLNGCGRVVVSNKTASLRCGSHAQRQLPAVNPNTETSMRHPATVGRRAGDSLRWGATCSFQGAVFGLQLGTLIEGHLKVGEAVVVATR